MTGIEYELGKCIPPRLFIVHKQNRISPNSGKFYIFCILKTLLFSIQVKIIASYYVLDGCIYQSPSLYSVLSHRILSSMAHLQSAIEYADSWLEFDVTKSRYFIKPLEKTTDLDVEMDQKQLIAPDKNKVDFITQLNNRFMNLP